MSRRRGSVDACGACGRYGHRAERGSRGASCSRSWLAALAVLAGETIADAARTNGVTRQSVHQTPLVATMRGPSGDATCGACGRTGHRTEHGTGSRSCSRSWLAALMVIDGHSVARAAEFFGISRNSVYQTLHRMPEWAPTRRAAIKVREYAKATMVARRRTSG